MKVIIAGSRNLFPSIEKIQKYVDKSGFKVTELVWGGASGVDQRGKEWADYMGIPVIPFPADWDGAEEKYGNRRAAGPIRNEAMVDYAEALILIWDKSSPGSSSIYEYAKWKDLPVFEVIVKKKRKRSN